MKYNKIGCLHGSVILVLLCLFSSCMKDLGNYSYKTINAISASGIDTLYFVNYYEAFTIDPSLSFTEDKTNDTSNYSYQWVIDHIAGTYGSPPVTLSTSRKLTVPERGFISILSNAFGAVFGTYQAYYRVTDKRTGVFKDTYFKISIGSPTYSGWLLLCDPGNGFSRLDMVSAFGADKLYPDILKAVGSAFPLNAKPSFVCSILGYLGPPTTGLDAIFLATGKKTALLGIDTFEYQPSYDLENFIPNLNIADYTGATMYNKGAFSVQYFCAQGNIYSFKGRNRLLNYLDGATVSFKASPLLAVNDDDNQSTPDDIFFNEDTKSFVRHPYRSSSCLSLPSGTLFNFSTRQELKYMQYVTYNGGEVFAVLDSLGNTNLARFTPAGKQHYYSQMTGTDIDKAEYFAVCPSLGYVFYAVGGKLYEYDYNLNKSILMKDFGSKKISLLKFQRFALAYPGLSNETLYTNLQAKLVVCTYDEQDPVSSGVFELYTVPDINGPLQLYKSYTGTGKVVSISYYERP